MTGPVSGGYAAVHERIASVRSRIAEAERRSARPEGSVGLLCVTKFNPREAVEAAFGAGIRLFGENRIAEAESKYAPGFPGARVHLLGHLQSNKAKRAVALFDCVESVDSMDILSTLAIRADAAGRVIDILFELNTGEESKTGFPDPESLVRAAGIARGLPSLRPRGLMTMAPYTKDELPIRRSFVECRETYERVREEFGFEGFDTLSMGMTNDFEMAVEEGSTLVRIGTAIFGARSEA